MSSVYSLAWLTLVLVSGQGRNKNGGRRWGRGVDCAGDSGVRSADTSVGRGRAEEVLLSLTLSVLKFLSIGIPREETSVFAPELLKTRYNVPAFSRPSALVHLFITHPWPLLISFCMFSRLSKSHVLVSGITGAAVEVSYQFDSPR